MASSLLRLMASLVLPHLAGPSSSSRTSSFSSSTIRERAAPRGTRPRSWIQATSAAPAPGRASLAQVCITPSQPSPLARQMLQPGFSRDSARPQVVLNSAPILAASRVGHNPSSRLPRPVGSRPHAPILASSKVGHNLSSRLPRPDGSRPHAPILASSQVCHNLSHAPILASSRVGHNPSSKASLAPPPLRSALKKDTTRTANEKKTVTFQESRNTVWTLSEFSYPLAPKRRWRKKYDPDAPTSILKKHSKGMAKEQKTVTFEESRNTVWILSEFSYPLAPKHTWPPKYDPDQDHDPIPEPDKGASIAELMSMPDWGSDPRTMALINKLLGL
ncbi:hypothetical protein MMC17_007333 [Xylographa soralifera]|nr:hypothetical protein [Xylographa soralifera]